MHRPLEAHADKKAFANHRHIIPKMGTTFGTPLPVLGILAAEIARQAKKEPQSVLSLLEMLWHDGSFEERQIVGKVMESGPALHGDNLASSCDFNSAANRSAEPTVKACPAPELADKARPWTQT